MLMTPGYEEKVYEKAQDKQKAMKRAVGEEFHKFKASATRFKRFRRSKLRGRDSLSVSDLRRESSLPAACC